MEVSLSAFLKQSARIGAASPSSYFRKSHLRNPDRQYVRAVFNPSGAHDDGLDDKAEDRRSISVLGLLLGMGAGGQADAESSDKVSKQARAALVQQAEAKADERVQEAVTDAEQSEQAAIDQAVTEALEAEKSKRKRLIKAAVAKAVDKVKGSSPKPKTVADTSEARTDPRFDTCGAANAAGYGNYQRGSDPEYNWYQDRDNDGSVCE